MIQRNLSSDDYRPHTSYANGSSESPVDVVAAVPHQSFFATTSNSIKANAIRGYDIFLNILVACFIFLTALVNLIKSIPVLLDGILFVIVLLLLVLIDLLKAGPTLLLVLFDLLKATPTLFKSMWKILRACPTRGQIFMGCALAIYAYAFITDPYLFGTPKEWMVGAFGLSCVCGWTCLLFKVVDIYATNFRAARNPTDEDVDHLRTAMNVVNEEGKQTQKGSEPAIPQFEVPQFGHAAYIGDQDEPPSSPMIRYFEVQYMDT
jgi:hypothetical protein